MTAQIGDSFKLDDSNYTMVAISEALNFDPGKYGIVPESICTACWRGFWCVYNINDKGIFLDNLYVNSQDDYYPEIEGVKAITEKEGDGRQSFLGHHLYKGLNIKIDYSGKILVGKDFLPQYYIHMGFQRAWAFEKLIELVFENGTLVEKNDQSEVAADIRKQIEKNNVFNKNMRQNTEKFVRNSFSLDYKTKAWWL